MTVLKWTAPAAHRSPKLVKKYHHSLNHSAQLSIFVLLLCLSCGSIRAQNYDSYFFSERAGVRDHQGSADGGAIWGQFNSPASTAVDAAGDIYVADAGNHAIRKITPAGMVITFAGLCGSSGNSDGSGSGARFYNPYGLTVDQAGNVYVTDTGNHTIRKITPTGDVTTLAGL